MKINAIFQEKIIFFFCKVFSQRLFVMIFSLTYDKYENIFTIMGNLFLIFETFF